MTEITPLDSAHIDAEADEARRPRFWSRLLETELFVPLEEEAQGETIRPVILDTAEGRIALVFDREVRLVDFMEGPTEFAAMSGRRLVKLLVEQDIALALNLGGAPSETILPVDALRWAVDRLTDLTVVREASVRDVNRPQNVPDVLLDAIAEKLPTLEGLARESWLVGVTYRDGTQGHMLAVIDALPPARDAIADALSEALRLSGLDAGQLDIVFLDEGAKALPALRSKGLGFEIPQRRETVREVTAPGSDPAKPPILR